MKIKHLIDCDADPKIPEWATLVEHKKSGLFEWDLDKVELHLEPEQKSDWIEGNRLYERSKEMPVMNVNIANYIVEHPELYPDAWRGKYVYFWGTSVRHRDGSLGVPYLVESDGRVVVYWGWLGYDWDDTSPAARFVSTQNSVISPGPSDFSTLTLRLEKLEAFQVRVEKWASQIAPPSL